MRLRYAIPMLAALLAGCGDARVVRVIDGRPELGRFIPEYAYSLFARGAEAEAAGDLRAAQRAFSYAAEADPESAEIWTRLGAVNCRLAPAGPVPADATDAFSRALALDPASAPALRERARCEAARGDLPAARLDAERALDLDPDDLDTALVRAEVLDLSGLHDDARRALRSLAARWPHSTVIAEKLRAGAPALDPLAAVDEALRAGDLQEARSRALKARLTGAELALRAVALGRASLAREQAALVLAADPADASARIALAAAADLAGDLPALSAAMSGIPHFSTAPSPLARLLFAEVLERRAGVEAARAWLGSGQQPGLRADEPRYAPGPGAQSQPGDPLLSATESRVRGALSRH